ncbi:hypothetical protein [Conexibacter sp. CPCC 206217]|uniref:hypothetical protein n=1 Tax=Conexibacter sp. CPCC 206217 TaxID=3064574 RepID=UPI002724F95D|nr:hypothetical protein [Conexibacter sp. CPCC 206217]MDO8209470.1 hypothetical protein [Conexibacter sp. CPCC 206217]
MPRRLLLPLLAALALPLAAAPSAFAAPAASSTPIARAAVDGPGADCADDELAVEEEDGTITCTSGDDESGGDWVDGDDGDVSGLCDDDWSDDDGEEWSDDDPAEASAADDDGCADEETVVGAPLLRALRATVAGQGRRAHVTVSWTLNTPGDVALTLERTEAGISSGKRCVPVAAKAKQARAKQARRHGKSCTRSTAVRGTITTAGEAGANTLELRRWKGRRLAPGTYRLTAEPIGDDPVETTTTFRLAPPARS